MRLRNNIFAAALDELKRRQIVKTQKELAQKMGVSEDTITRILKDRTEVTEDAITKLQTASGCIFNLQWLRGESVVMLLEDVEYYAQHPEDHPLRENDTHQSAPIDADFCHKALELNSQVIADIRKDLDYFKQLVLDKDATIQDNAEQIISLQSRLSAALNELEHTKNTLAAVRKNFDAKVAEVDRLKVELEKQRDPLARYPFTPGVADGDNDRTLIATDE